MFVLVEFLESYRDLEKWIHVLAGCDGVWERKMGWSGLGVWQGGL